MTKLTLPQGSNTRMWPCERYSAEQWLTGCMLLLLTLCGAYVRISGLSEWAWSGDDALHLLYAQEKTLSLVISDASRFDAHPPLSYILLHFMMKLSQDALFLRCISLVPGILLIPLYYALGARVSGRLAGLFMAFTATFGYGTVILSEPIRSYALLLDFIVGGAVVHGIL